MVIFRYKDFNYQSFIPKNRDYVSTEVFLNNIETYKYDSYVFGSSVALFVRPSIWKEYLHKDAHVFSFDASRENIAGIWSKIKYIDEKGYPLNNALIVIDYNFAFEEPDRKNSLFMKDPRIFRSSVYNFQYKHFIKVFDLRFIGALLDYLVNRNFKPYMSSYLLNEQSCLDLISNEYQNFSIQEELKQDSIGYYQRRADKFPEQDGQFREYRPQISEAQIEMMREMKSIFGKMSTNYRIIVAPNYQQISVNRSDLEIIRMIFGEEAVFDFTGINNITDEISNFYDPLHFKVFVGKQLLDIVYSNNLRNGL